MEIISEVKKTIAVEVNTTLKFKSKIDLEFLRKMITMVHYDISDVYLINPKNADDTIKLAYWDLIEDYGYFIEDEAFKLGLKHRRVDLRKKYDWRIELEDECESMDIHISYDTKSNTIQIKGQCSVDEYNNLMEKLRELDNGEYIERL